MIDGGMRVRVETELASAVTVGDVTVTPRSQSLVVSLPFGQLVWKRPTDVLVERGGRTDRIRVTDTTRIIVLGLCALVAALATAMVLSTVRRTRRQASCASHERRSR